MKFLKRIFGICETPPPADPKAWSLNSSTVRIDLACMPELKNPGSGVRLEGKGLDPRLLVVHGDDGEYHALDNRCTHMGRRIDVLTGSGRIECCSVSKSTYSYDGRPVSGAAKAPLATFPVALENNTLTIILRK